MKRRLALIGFLIIVIGLKTLPLISPCIIFGCLGFALNRGPDRVDTSDFDAIRSSVTPYLDEWFEEARRHPYYVYSVDYELVRELSSEDAYIQGIEVTREEAGTTFYALFIGTGSVRGYRQGYIYTPTGRLPEWDGLRTKQIDDHWFVYTDTS